MSDIKEMKVATKLALGFGILIVLGMIQAGYSWSSTQKLAGDLEELSGDRLDKLTQLAEVKDNMNVIASSVRNIVLVTEAAEKQSEKKRIDDMRARNVEILKAFADKTTSEKGKALLEGIANARVAMLPPMNKTIELAISDKDAEATTALLTEVRGAHAAYFKAVDAAIDYQKEEAARLTETAHADVSQSTWWLLLLALCGAVIGSATALAITRGLSRQLGGEPSEVVSITRAVAEGNLAIEVHARAGDTTSIMAALADMRSRLATVVGQVRQSSDSIATGSAQIATGNADLSQRTEEQASNLQQTAASMEQLTGTVRSNAETADQANRLATDATAAASKGGEVVGQVVATMQEIAESSRKISDIIGVIDGIAFQTNILALNAAVEAARAGEQGRGFAVVASEVRSLAQRSANAAKEIKTLIGDSVEKVETGTRQVNDAGTSMEEIVSQVKRVSALINEISAATAEQTSGISQVGDAVNQLDQVTQQNAALVEESAAAAESLKHQAARLAEVVDVFRLDANQMTASSKRSSPVPAKPVLSRAVTAMKIPAVKQKPSTPSAAVATPPATPRASSHTAGSSPSDDWETF